MHCCVNICTCAVVHSPSSVGGQVVVIASPWRKCSAMAANEMKLSEKDTPSQHVYIHTRTAKVRNGPLKLLDITMIHNLLLNTPVQNYNTAQRCHLQECLVAVYPCCKGCSTVCVIKKVTLNNNRNLHQSLLLTATGNSSTLLHNSLNLCEVLEDARYPVCFSCSCSRSDLCTRAGSAGFL